MKHTYTRDRILYTVQWDTSNRTEKKFVSPCSELGKTSQLWSIKYKMEIVIKIFNFQDFFLFLDEFFIFEKNLDF